MQTILILIQITLYILIDCIAFIKYIFIKNEQLKRIYILTFYYRVKVEVGCRKLFLTLIH